MRLWENRMQAPPPPPPPPVNVHAQGRRLVYLHGKGEGAKNWDIPQLCVGDSTICLHRMLPCNYACFGGQGESGGTGDNRNPFTGVASATQPARFLRRYASSLCGPWGCLAGRTSSRTGDRTGRTCLHTACGDDWGLARGGTACRSFCTWSPSPPLQKPGSGWSHDGRMLKRGRRLSMGNYFTLGLKWRYS